MNNLVDQLVPFQARQFIRACFHSPFRIKDLIVNYLYDLSRYTYHSSSLQFLFSKQQLQSWIDADYHKLEKGMALHRPRPGFGQGVAERLIRQTESYITKYGTDKSIQNSISVLNVYKEFNQTHDIDLPYIYSKIQSLVDTYLGPNAQGGYHNMSKQEWLSNAKINLLPFFKSRHSVRDFSDKPVDFLLIKQAVEMAIYTPTVCNRQAAKVHAYTDNDSRQKIINCQMGNAGFGEQIKAVLMITVDRQCFFSAGERNQCWIDGGLLSMSVIYALHSLGLGTCCLNWSVTKSQDIKLRTIADIKNSEAVIMMIAVGHLKDEFKIAKSARKSIDHFLIQGKCK